MGPRARPAAGKAPVGLILAMTLSLTACDSSRPAATEPTERAPSSPVEVPADVEGAPSNGTCWDVPSANVADPKYWYDDSRAVACSEPHTTETVRTIRLDKPTPAAAKEEVDLCLRSVDEYIGISTVTWIPWQIAMFLPSKDQIDQGASWARCDASFPSAWDLTAVRTTTSSAFNVAADPPPQLWACLDVHPTETDQPLVSCDEPHAYEQTGQLAYLQNVYTYPAAARLAAEAEAQCADGVPDEHDGAVEVTASWTPRKSFEPGAELVGECFFTSRDGEPLPPRN